MSRLIRHIMLIAAALGLLGLVFASCGDGCGENERMFNGTCIPAYSDGDTTSDGDTPIILPDGDTPRPDGDQTDGDEEDVGLSGTGRCGDPYAYGETPYNEEQIQEGELSDMGSTLTAALCALTDQPLDGDADASLPGMGPEVVLKLALKVGDTLNLVFGGTGFDALIYIQSQCSDSAGECMLEVVNLAGEGEQEQIEFSPEFQGDYYIIMDSSTALASGVWRYAFTVEGEGPTDGDADTTDGDNVDGDVVDGDVDAVDGDIVDGDEIDGDAVDGDATDGDTIDGDEGGVPVFHPQIIATYLVEDSDTVTGNMTDLYWKLGGTAQLYTMNDLGLVLMSWNGSSFESPLVSVTDDSYRGLTFVDSLPVYLNLDQRVIQGPAQGNIDLPLGFGSQPTGLAYLNGTFYATDGTAGRLYVFTYNDESSTWANTYWDFAGAGTLAGVTAGAGKVWALSVGGVSSTINRLDPQTGEIEAVYIVDNVLLNGICYNADQGAMWGAHGGLRTVVRLNGDFLATSL